MPASETPGYNILELQFRDAIGTLIRNTLIIKKITRDFKYTRTSLYGHLYDKDIYLLQTSNSLLGPEKTKIHINSTSVHKTDTFVIRTLRFVPLVSVITRFDLYHFSLSITAITPTTCLTSKCA